MNFKYLGGIRVSVHHDDYDFEMHPWSGVKNWFRNLATMYGKPSTGQGFRIFFYGIGQIDLKYPSKRL